MTSSRSHNGSIHRIFAGRRRGRRPGLRKLSSKERERLAIRAAGARHPVTRRRATILLATDDGASPSAIAASRLTDEAQVAAVVSAFNARGFESLSPQLELPARRRRAMTRSRLARAALAALVPTLLLGVVVAFWSELERGKLPEAREVSVEAGIHEITHTWGATVGDFDDDGRDDLLIAPHKRTTPPPRLYRNVGGRFERVPDDKLPSTRKDHHGCDWGDVNDDGLRDLYCSVGGGKGTKRNPNTLWVQQEDGSFTDETTAYRVADRDGRGRDVAFLDANGDGLDDIFVANGYPRRDGRRSENRLFLNVRGERFRSAPEYGLDHELGGWRVQAVDHDGDRWTDLLVCGQDERVHLFRNRKGLGFEEIGARVGADGNCRSALLANLDGDSRLDLVRVTRGRLVVKRQGDDGHFARSYDRQLDNGGDVAAGRVDGDGDDDLYVLQRGPPGDDRDDLLLFNQDRGSDFREGPIPQTGEGKAESVVAIDHDGNSRVGFIVLNGKNKSRGPIRLIAFD